MRGVKTEGKSERSLIEALSEQVGYAKKSEPDLAKTDTQTGTYFCATIENAPRTMIEDAKAFYEAEVVMLRAQAEASVTSGNTSSLNKRAAYARLASQALEYYASKVRRS